MSKRVTIKSFDGVDVSFVAQVAFDINEIDKIKTYPNSVVKNKFALELINYSNRISLIVGLEFENEYYIPTKQTIFIPYSFPNIGHEIAHMVEMKDYSRCIKTDWGFLDPEKSVKSNKPNRIIAAAAREIRVRAIESIFSNNVTKIGKNQIWIEAIYGILPYGKFDTFKDFLDWEEDLHNKTIKAWNADRIETEWKSKLDYIHNWMETK